MSKVKYFYKVFCLVVLCFYSLPVYSLSFQDSNDCPTSTGPFCQRTGSCSIQGANWYQYVTIDINEIFTNQGWTGLCDMVHVALVQGNCSPPQAITNVTVNLSSTTFASIPDIVGPLSCAAPIIADGDVAPLGAPDGKIDSADLLIMTRIIAGLLTPDANTLARGDVYPKGAPDGVINISDLVLMYPLLIASQ